MATGHSFEHLLGSIVNKELELPSYDTGEGWPGADEVETKLRGLGTSEVLDLWTLKSLYTAIDRNDPDVLDALGAAIREREPNAFGDEDEEGEPAEGGDEPNPDDSDAFEETQPASEPSENPAVTGGVFGQ